MSNVYTFLPKLTVNGQFMSEFITAQTPCFALGLVEERKQKRGLLALRPDETISREIADSGFRFGDSLFGNSAFEVIHSIFEFYGFRTYNVLVNPNNPLVRHIITTMVENQDYIFFAINTDLTVLAFGAEFGQSDSGGLKANLRQIQNSTTTEAQYQKAVSHFEISPEPAGTLLNWVCRDNLEFLDLTDDPLELSPS